MGFALLLSPLTAFAAEPDAALTAAAERILAEHDVPALGVVVVRADGATRAGVAGVRERGGDDAVTPDDRWHLGSCTKAMTATLIARLVEAGTLRWDLTVAQALPREADRFLPAYRDATLRQLLTHRAGVTGGTGPAAAWAAAFAERGTPAKQRQRFLRAVLGETEPGSADAYEYSNVGYALAGHIAETVARVPYEKLMQREVFAPLGMENAGFGPPAAKRRDQPVGHAADGTPMPRDADNPPAIAPAGRAHATLADWARFVRAHLGPVQTADGEPFLSAATLAELHRPEPGPGQAYAAGWITTERGWAGAGGRGAVLTHAGSNTMWYAVAWLAPERGFAVLAACNQGGDAGSAACDAAAAAGVGWAGEPDR